MHRNQLKLALALLLGALLPCAFAPLSWYPLAVLIPAGLFLLWQHASPRQAFWLGLCFGIGLFGVGVSWVYVAIHVYGESSIPVAVLLTGLFVLILALVPAAQGAVISFICRFLPTRTRTITTFVWILPATWLLFEWIRSWLFTGFPWLSLGYSQIDSPLSGYAPLLGIFGISWLLAFSAGLAVVPFYLHGATRWLAWLVIVLIWSGGALLRAVEWTQPVGDPIRVAIVQGNQDQITKWDSDKIRAQMQAYANLSEPYWADHDLIIWPENALTILYPDDVPADFQTYLEQHVKEYQTDLILGAPYGNYQTYYSSLLVLGEQPGVYNKRHLVPFGEYVPLQNLLRGLIHFFDLPMSGFTPGDAQQSHLVAAGQPLAPSICYEDAFGSDLLDFLPEATLLVNGSNNAWYGHSWAPHQHLQISRMRALETGRMLMRATTNGISAVIDQHGQITAQSPQFVSHVISAEVQPRQGATPYVTYGNLPILLLLSLSVITMTILIIRQQRH